MNNYQIREKSYTEALASTRVGGNLSNSLVKTVPNIKEEIKTFDLAYFQGLAREQESRNLDYMRKKASMHYGNRKR